MKTLLQKDNLGKQPLYIWAVLGLFALTLIPSIWMVARILPQIRVNYDVTAYKAYQTERTLQQLYYTLEHAINNPEVVDVDELVADYDHAFAAATLLDKSPRGDLHNEIHEYNQSIQALVEVLSRFRPDFDAGAPLASNTEKMKEIRFAIYRILPQVKNMVWAANQASERFIARRNSMLMQQSLMVIALVLVLIAGLLALLWTLYQKLQREQEHSEKLRIIGEELRLAKVEADNANEAKATLVGVISHELRTPFQGLMGMLELLTESPLPEADRKLLDSAQGSAQHLLQLLNDLVDLSVLETRTLKLSEEPLHLPSFLEASFDTMRVAAVKSGTILQASWPATLPQWVRVDAKRLRQMLFNISKQSMRLTQNETVDMQVLAADDPAPEASHAQAGRLSVRFSGVHAGLNEVQLERLFGSTFDAENLDAPRSNNAGMGLEIARNLARSMGGDVLARCTDGGGFTFEIVLPLKVLAPSEHPSSSAQAQPSQTALQAAAGKPSMRLLIAEDSPVNQLYLRRVLEKMGHTVHFVDNGIAALECLQQEDFDAVLLDYHMPIVNGVEAAGMIRRLNSSKAQVKIIMVTADVLGHTKDLALQAGVDEVLTKPVSTQQLREALAR